MKNFREFKILKRGIYLTLTFVFILWLVKSIEWAQNVDFGLYGILPRTLKGGLGIITGPLIHGDLYHLISNTFPLIILGLVLFYFYHKIALEVFFWIYLATGFWVWIIGRESYHIGASGLVYGLAMFVFWSGILRKNPRSLAISMVVFFLYGYMIYGLLPLDNAVSWESHVMGSVAGIFLAIYFRKVPLYLGEKRTTIFTPDNEILNESESENEESVSHSADFPINFNYTFREKK